MIAGIGVDIAETVRFADIYQQYGERFAQRILTRQEFEQFQSKQHPEKFLATRFAAKEAAVKALGTGFDQGVGYKSIEVRNNANGKPELRFYDVAASMMEQRKIRASHVSISDEKHYVIAMVIMETD